MDTDESTSKLNPLQALVIRRSRKRAWAYALWLIVYLPTALLFAGEMSAHSGAGILAMLLLLVPVAITVTQMLHPTLLGWAILLLPSVLYAGVVVFYLIRDAVQGRHQWDYDLEGFIIGIIFVAAFVAVCVALAFARPRLRGVTHAA